MSDNPFALSNIEPQQDSAPASDNPFALGAIQRDQRQDLRVNLESAVRTNPQQAAEAARLAKKYETPDEVLLRNLQDVKLRDAVAEADKKLQTSPRLADYMRTSPFALKQAHDDLGALVAIEEAVTPRTLLGTAQDIGVTALKGAVGLPQAFVGLADIVSGGYAGKAVEAIGVRFNDTQNILDTLYSPAQQKANAAVAEADGFVSTIEAMLSNPSTIATAAGESVPQMLGGAAVGRGILAAAPKVAPWLAAAMGEGVMGAGSAAENMRSQSDDGLLGARQTLAAVASGAGTTLFGTIGGKAAARLGLADMDTALVTKGVDAATAKTLQQGFAASVVKAGISEGIFEELPQSVQEQMWQNFAADRPLGEGVGKVAAQGLLAGASMGSGFQVSSDSAQRVSDRIGKVQQARDEADKLMAAMQAAEASTLRTNNPDEFRAVMEHLAQDGKVYVYAQVLNQLPPEQLQALGVVESLPEALAANSSVEIKLSDLLTHAPGTPAAQVLIDNARATPDGLSAIEVQQAGDQASEFIKTEAERVLAEAQDATAWQDSTNKVKQGVLDQLNSAGRFSPEVNEAKATLHSIFFSVMAQRLSTTPEELFARYNLRVEAKLPGQVERLDQGGENWMHGSLGPLEGELRPGTGTLGEGFYLTNGENQARLYPKMHAIKNKVANPDIRVTQMDVAPGLNIYQMDSLPAGRVSVEKLREAGYDGVRYRNELNIFDLKNVRVRDTLNQSTEQPRLMAVQGERLDQGGDVGLALNTLTRDDLEDDQVFSKPLPDVDSEDLGYVKKLGANSVGSGGFHVYVKGEDVREAGPHEFYFYDNSDEPIGFARLTKTRDQASVNMIAFTEDARGSGYGKAFYKYLLDELGVSVKSDKEITEGTAALYRSLAKEYGASVDSDGRVVISKQLNQSTQPLPDTIEVDGKQRPTTNSNGQPIAATEEGVRNFWKWFGNSKVVDASGKPLVVYHGTASGGFDAFDPARQGTSSDPGYNGTGFYFSADANYAGAYAEPSVVRGGAASVYPVYLSIENPLRIRSGEGRSVWTSLGVKDLGETGAAEKTAAARADGYDGVIVTRDDAMKEIVTFAPTQIKSAIGNSGEFDPANPNILMQSGNERDLIVAHNLTSDNLRNALELGGLPAPSLAITKVDSPIQGFGEITLVGDTKLAKPSAKNPVFNADVYSPRFPDVRVKVDDRKVVATLFPLHEAAKDVGLYAISPDRVANEMERNQFVRSIGDVVNDTGMRYGYAVHVLGKDIDVPKKSVEVATDLRPTKGSIVTQEPLAGVLASIPDFGKTVTADSEESAKIAQALYSAMLNRFIGEEAEKGNGDGVEAGAALANRRIKMFAEGEGESVEMAPGVTATWPERMTLSGLSKLWNAWRAQTSPDEVAPQPNKPRQEVDIEKLSTMLDEVVDKDQMRQWVRDQLAPTIGEKRIVKDDGKTAAYSLQNIVKVMTGKVRDAEGFNYGLGNARSKGAKSFKSIGDIQANRDQVQAKVETDAAIKDAEARFSNLSDELDQYLARKGSIYSPGSFEALVDAIGLSYAQGMDSALNMAGFRDVPANLTKKVQEFAAELTNLPTEYFEAKPQRAVGVDEFRGAVIPDTTPTDVRTALTDMGLTLVEYRKGDEASRAQAVRALAEQLDAETKDVLFHGKVANRGSSNQSPRGTYSPSQVLITLGESANLSTFPHESGHFFLEVLIDLASQPGAPTGVVDDVAAILKWFGIKGDESVGGLDAGGELAQKIDQTETPEFKNWFGDSQAREPMVSSKQKLADMPPLRMYHTTRNADFDVFEANRPTINSTTFGDVETSRAAMFFTPSVEDSNAYGKLSDGRAVKGAATVPVYLRAQDPLYLTDGIEEVDAQRLIEAGMSSRFVYNALGNWAMFDDEGGKELVETLKAAGYDSVVFNDENPITGEAFEAWAVFDPAQIKSAIGNSGAFDPNNPSILAQDGNLPTDSTQPAGRTPIETWNAMTLDQKRPHHERFAESFEAYLLEGKAPTAELQPLFRKFRSWLVNVYKSLSEFMRGRNLDISPEIRQVFDRMLATDEQIRQAEDAAGMLPDFEATNEAIEKLQARSLRDLKWTVGARSKALKALQREAANLRKAVKAEVTAEVEQMPEFKAQREIAEFKRENKRKANDVELAIIAEANGFESADAMTKAIDLVGKKADMIEGKTDQRMLENFGELATPEALEAAANDAVHNEARARALATELKAQADMLNPRQDTGRTASNGRAITVNALTEAAKQFAQNLTARRRVKDLKNAAWQHRSAESRAAKAWQEATAKGKTEEAVAAKRDQLLNNYTAKAMGEAQAEVRKVLEFFAKVTKGNNEKLVDKGRDPDVVNAARAVLAAYDIAPRLEKTANDYMEAVAKYDAQMYGALKPGLDAMLANAKPFGELTVDEMGALRDEIGSMWELAKTSRQMEIDGDRVDIDDAAQALVNRMVEIGVPDEIPGEKGAITNRQELGIKLQFAKAILSRVEQWAERMDGKFGGPFLRYVFQPVKDAADRYRTARVQHREKFTKLVEGVAPFIKPGPIAAPELGYTFGNARDSGMAELLHALTHTGNDSNKRKLLLGRKWATENADGTLDTTRWDAFVARLISEGTLRKEHYDFAQGVWDLLEETKPLAQEAHRKVFGRYFAEVTANEFTTPFGVYRGGYAPAQTDSRLVGDAKLRELAEGENESMAYAFPSAPSGFTNSRVEYNKPLLLDLRALAQHMDKVLLFSHMQPAISDARRLLTRKNVSYALDRIDPGAYEGMIMPWLNRSAKQIVETPIAGDRRISRFMGAVRSRAGMALMMANLSNTVQQITGFSTAAIKVKPSLMLKAVGRFTASPKEFKRSVAEASPYMKDRMLNEVSTMNDAVEQILVDPTLLEKGQAWTQKHAYFLQSAVDNTMSPIIWTAAYNQAIEEGSEARDAVRFADGVIRQTQGSTLPEDVSRFETGPAVMRVFTQFVGYFNMMANTNATAVSQIANEMGLRKGAGKLLYTALVGLLVPIWVAEAIAQAFRGGPGDEDDDGYLDDWLMAVFGLGTIRGLTATVPIAGQGAQMIVSRFNNNPADDKFSLSPAVSLIESAVGSPASVYKAIIEDGNAQKAVRDAAAAATLLTGLPFYAAARPVGYAAGVAQGKIEPTDAVDAVRGTVTGTASKESKTP